MSYGKKSKGKYDRRVALGQLGFHSNFPTFGYLVTRNPKNRLGVYTSTLADAEAEQVIQSRTLDFLGTPEIQPITNRTEWRSYLLFNLKEKLPFSQLDHFDTTNGLRRVLYYKGFNDSGAAETYREETSGVIYTAYWDEGGVRLERSSDGLKGDYLTPMGPIKNQRTGVFIVVTGISNPISTV